MALNEPLIMELRHEADVTRKMLGRIPDSVFGWKPHEKSMPLGRLATHVAELAGWMVPIVSDDELDFAKVDYKPYTAADSKELIRILDDNTAKAVDLLKTASDEHLLAPWKLRSGDVIYFELPRIQVIRSMVLSHVIHHRGQLSVFLRMNDIPLPMVYGPTADEQN